MYRRLREQARSHTGPRVFTVSVSPPIPCGGGLARESGRSACIHVECAEAFAGKLCAYSKCLNIFSFLIRHERL